MRLEEFDIHIERDLLKLDKKSPKEISRSLKKLGFREVSSGHFGKVFVLDKGKRVVKVSMKPDTGYELFLDLCMRNISNPHLPKVSWKQNFIYIDKGIEKKGFIVVLEKLSPIPLRNGYPTESFVKKHADQFAILNAIANLNLNIELDIPYKSIPPAKLKKSHTEVWAHPLYKAIEKLIKTFRSELVWDLHWKNIMYRPEDNALVITDPYAVQSEITG